MVNKIGYELKMNTNNLKFLAIRKDDWYILDRRDSTEVVFLNTKGQQPTLVQTMKQ